MLKKLSSNLKSRPAGEKLDQSPKKSSVGGVPGAAVPYTDPAQSDSVSSQADSIGRASSLLTTSSSEYEGHLLGEAAAHGDTDTIKQLLKSGYDINSKDERGYTALLRAAEVGQAKMVRHLLLHGADVAVVNERNKSSLALAVEQGHIQAVGVLLDYMHSVDKRHRDPFVALRAHRVKGGETYIVQEVQNCTKIISLRKQGCDSVQVLVAHKQRAADLAIFLYSVLDIPVQHAFIVNTTGQTNMKNFQRFEDHAKSESLTILNTSVRVLEAVKYSRLKTLILVSCSLHKFSCDKMPCLELLDVRFNKLTELPNTLCECSNLKTFKVAYNHLKALPQEIGKLQRTLTYIDCSYNYMKQLPQQIVKCKNLAHLYCDHNYLTDLPLNIGVLVELETLVVDNNKLSNLPLSVSGLSKLLKVSFHSNPLQNIPVDFPNRPAEVREYLQSLQDDPVPNNTVKLVLVGQEGVGKTTLLKALKRTMWAIPHSPSTPKTDGMVVKEIQLDELTLRCFDCGGDVDFNETHNFFISQGALYLACFNLAEYCMATVERSSFLLGRLQLWLQYIFSKVPGTQVVIVGTHADHDSLSKNILEEIWCQLRTMMKTARTHHQSYFHGDQVAECLLCQSDPQCLRRSSSSGAGGYVNLTGQPESSKREEETSFNTAGNVISFPHIIGYYEVSSVRSVGNTAAFQFNTNQSIEHLKTAVITIAKKMISTNPEIPRRWSDVRNSLLNYAVDNPDNCVSSLPEIAGIARAHGISGNTELNHMLQFLKAQGSLLFFPQIKELKEVVILDPEWLATVFSKVVSYRDTGINNEGFIEQQKLRQAWGNIEEALKDKLLSLLRHFGLCLPLPGSSLELFPCKLPIGEPDELIWPVTPPKGTRQLTYSITFPSMLPPPFFSDLIVSVFRYRAEVPGDRAHYYANSIVDTVRVDRIGCRDCKLKPENPKDNDASLLHQVSYQFLAYNRTINMSVRGTVPCCTVRKAGRIINKVVSRYEGMRSVNLDSLMCPGCFLQNHPEPHKFNPKSLQQSHKDSEKVTCDNGHTFSSVKALLTGVLYDNCMPNAATVKSNKTTATVNFSGCPQMFVVLPVNKDGVSFASDFTLYVSSVLFDGFAVHLLCEFPDGYHMCNAPGYRLKTPKEFMTKYGTHAIAVLRLLGHMAGSTVSSQHGGYTKAVTQTIGNLIKDYHKKFPNVKDGMSGYKAGDLVRVINDRARKLHREDLRRHLHIMDKPHSFGPLRRLQYGEGYLWLCADHYKQLKVLSIGTIGPHTKRESLA